MLSLCSTTATTPTRCTWASCTSPATVAERLEVPLRITASPARRLHDGANGTAAIPRRADRDRRHAGALSRRRRPRPVLGEPGRRRRVDHAPQPGRHARRRRARLTSRACRATSTRRPSSERRPVRRRVLRLLGPRRVAHRSAAPRCSSRPRGRRSRTPATTRARYPGAIGVFGGCELSSYLYQLYHNLDTLRLPRRHAADGHQRQGPPLHAGVVPAQPARARASSCRPPARRRSSPSRWRARACTPARCDMALAGGVHGPRAAARRLLLHRRLDPVARRPLPARSTPTRRARSSAAASASSC